jgi:hypothetical protein
MDSELSVLSDPEAAERRETQRKLNASDVHIKEKEAIICLTIRPREEQLQHSVLVKRIPS